MADVAGDVLYGVKLAVLEELDPTTELPKVGGFKVSATTTQGVKIAPVVSKGTEDVARSDDQILAVVKTSDLVYAYNLTLTDNRFHIETAANLEGGTIRTTGEAPDEVIAGYDSPMLSDGNKALLMKATFYVAVYKGASIDRFVKITFNKVMGTPFEINIAKEFYVPEYTIFAVEATKASLPVRSIDYVDALPA